MELTFSRFPNDGLSPILSICALLKTCFYAKGFVIAYNTYGAWNPPVDGGEGATIFKVGDGPK